MLTKSVIIQTHGGPPFAAGRQVGETVVVIRPSSKRSRQRTQEFQTHLAISEMSAWLLVSNGSSHLTGRSRLCLEGQERKEIGWE